MFVAASFENKEETNYLCSLIRKSGFIDYCFARDEKVFTDSKEMMKRAKEEIAWGLAVKGKYSNNS